MCVRTTCQQCGKLTWAGCGAHVELVLAGVPYGQRCRCGEPAADAKPAAFTLGMKKHLTVSYEEALQRLPAALKEEGFGVLTEIDIQDVLKKKLGVAFRPYRIFGACNPTLAYEALQKNPHVGVLMPCNIVVTQEDDGTATVVAVDPMQTAAMEAGPAMETFAKGVHERLTRVMERL